MTSTGRGRKAGDKIFSKQMVDALLDIVSQVLPVDDGEWEKVATEFNTRCKPKTPREVKDVKCKFDNLQKPLKTGSGGDPHYQRAKEIESLIREKAGSMVYSTGVSVDHLRPLASGSGNDKDIDGCCVLPELQLPSMSSQLTPSPSPSHHHHHHHHQHHHQHHHRHHHHHHHY